MIDLVLGPTECVSIFTAWNTYKSKSSIKTISTHQKGELRMSKDYEESDE
jgi:hypothetical protein